MEEIFNVSLPRKACTGQLRQSALCNCTWNEGQDLHTLHQDMSSTNHSSYETHATPGIDDPAGFSSLKKPKSAQLFENDAFWIQIIACEMLP